MAGGGGGDGEMEQSKLILLLRVEEKAGDRVRVVELINIWVRSLAAVLTFGGLLISGRGGG